MQGAGMSDERSWWSDHVMKLQERLARVEADGANTRLNSERVEREHGRRLGDVESEVGELSKAFHAMRKDMKSGLSGLSRDHKEDLRLLKSDLQTSIAAAMEKNAAIEAGKRVRTSRRVWVGGVSALALLSSGSPDIRNTALDLASKVLPFF